MIKLVEHIVEKASVVKENLPKGVLARAWYPIMRFGQINANRRIYEKAVADRILMDENVTTKLKTRTLFGNQEHPVESQVKLSKDDTSHIISEFKIDEKTGVLSAAFDILPTEAGKFINVLLEAGCLVGVSTRADGELEEKIDETGNKYSRVIPESYRFQTVDFTGDPSTPNAVPENIIKAVESHYNDRSISKEVAIALLESVKTDAAKTLEAIIIADKQHSNCKCKISDKKCSSGCSNLLEKNNDIKDKSVVKSVVQEGSKGNNKAKSNTNESNSGSSKENESMQVRKLQTSGKEVKEDVQMAITIEPKIKEFIDDNWSTFLSNENAIETLSSVFKITPEKAKEYIDQAVEGKGEIKPIKYTEEVKEKVIVDGDSKLLKSIIKRAIKLAEENGIMTPDINAYIDYIEDLTDYFDEKVYLGIDDKELLQDIKTYIQAMNEKKLKITEAFETLSDDMLMDKYDLHIEKSQYYKTPEEEKKNEKMIKALEAELKKRKLWDNEYVGERKKRMNEKSELVVADWKDFGGFVDQLQQILPKFGIFVYQDPVSEGSDQVGVILSDKKLSKEDISKKFGVTESALLESYRKEVISLSKKLSESLIDRDKLFNEIMPILNKYLEKEAPGAKLGTQEVIEVLKDLIHELKVTIGENKKLEEMLQVGTRLYKELKEKFQSYKLTPEEIAIMQKELEDMKKAEAAAKAEIEAVHQKSKKEIEEIKESHRKELIKSYVDSKVSSMGLKLPKQTLTLLESCGSKDEVNAEIRKLQDAIREGITQSVKLSEIVVESGTPTNPEQAKIDVKVAKAMSGFGM